MSSGKSEIAQVQIQICHRQTHSVSNNGGAHHPGAHLFGYSLARQNRISSSSSNFEAFDSILGNF